MAFFPLRRVAILLLITVAFVCAEKNAASIKSMSVPEIEEKLQVRSTKTPAARTEYETHQDL
jgi:hypothetical protein